MARASGSRCSELAKSSLLYVLQGRLRVKCGTVERVLERGGFAYCRIVLTAIANGWARGLFEQP